jgi:hypothetical protein
MATPLTGTAEATDVPSKAIPPSVIVVRISALIFCPPR